jgi:hypothetical protein
MRTLTILLTAAALTAAAAIPAAAPASGPTASAASTNCRSTLKRYYYSLGASYTTRLTVSGISCSSGISLTRAYHSCRKRNGGVKGRCSSVSGYRCTERRITGRFQFQASATCKRGSRAFSLSYSQNT